MDGRETQEVGDEEIRNRREGRWIVGEAGGVGGARRIVVVSVVVSDK